AGRVALNWVGDARTALDNAVTAYGYANAEIDKITARITILTTASTGHLALMKAALTANFSSAITQIGDAEDELDSAASACAAIDAVIGDYTTTADKAVTSIEDALLRLDDAVTHIGVIKTAIATNDSAIDTEVGLIKTQLDAAVVDLTTDIDAVLNTVTDGVNVPQGLTSKAMGLISSARGYTTSIESLMKPDEHYGVLAGREINLAMGQLRQALAFITLEGAVTSENALSVRAYVATAQGYIREAMAYVQADAQQTASYARLIGSELQTINGLISQAGGYFQEANMSIRTSTAINSLSRWGMDRIQMALNELNRIAPSVRVSHATTRS
ncbi:MAG: hypothetical protein KAJ19_27805, partial [Gammaproteobacteria bacterium]|nr:hypothetical protein [Gammaproteobacteria bacterium]